MAWPKRKKQTTKRRILISAAHLFTQKGYDQVSITEVMRHANLTHGGFYAHFDSKQSLYAEAIQIAARNSFFAKMPQAQQAPLDDADLMRHLLNGYLSPMHLASEQPSCPLAFLVTDAAHQNQKIRHSYTQTYRALVKRIGKWMPWQTTSADATETHTDLDERALAFSAMMIGGVAIAKTLNDPAMAERLLTACRLECEKMLEN